MDWGEGTGRTRLRCTAPFRSSSSVQDHLMGGTGDGYNTTLAIQVRT